MKFHHVRGRNVVLCDNLTKAVRSKSFAHGLAFSERPLRLGELFLFEVVETQPQWSGHFRLGLSEVNPTELKEVPMYALPDLERRCRCWIYMPQVFSGQNGEDYEHKKYPSENFKYKPFLETSYGNVPMKLLLPDSADVSEFDLESLRQISRRAFDIGSRIGMMYNLNDRGECEIDIIVNGEHLGTIYTGSLVQKPLHAVVDLYGSTQAIRILQILEVDALKKVCRDRFTCLTEAARLNESINEIDIPHQLKLYLLYQD